MVNESLTFGEEEFIAQGHMYILRFSMNSPPSTLRNVPTPTTPTTTVRPILNNKTGGRRVPL